MRGDVTPSSCVDRASEPVTLSGLTGGVREIGSTALRPCLYLTVANFGSARQDQWGLGEWPNTSTARDGQGDRASGPVVRLLVPQRDDATRAVWSNIDGSRRRSRALSPALPYLQGLAAVRLCEIDSQPDPDGRTPPGKPDRRIPTRTCQSNRRAVVSTQDVEQDVSADSPPTLITPQLLRSQPAPGGTGRRRTRLNTPWHV